MKVREIILDFTSLLDVVMIILFFFILFSSFDVETATEKANQAEASYIELIEENEKIQTKNEQEQQEWREKASKEWERILSADANAVNNQKALTAYNNGESIYFNLQNVEKSDTWTLSVLYGTKKAGEISSNESRELREKIKVCLERSGYKKDDVIISSLTYDGDSYGTEIVVPLIESAITDVQREYTGLYFTTINISK
ncbi:hypothetical protein [Ruminococcus sp.]|uniref:hypothetical protein n=1 Tax=Ruminococcus sp. TaxID=41978 RepID=UPI0025F19F22|nr:hypothetical protein [Ruminococcus sp.]